MLILSGKSWKKSTPDKTDFVDETALGKEPAVILHAYEENDLGQESISNKRCHAIGQDTATHILHRYANRIVDKPPAYSEA